MDTQSALAAITMFLAAGAGAYLGAYLKKKGENLATHEDIDQLNEQVASVTKTTMEIEAKISNEMWDRQKQWELKRDALVAVATTVQDLDSSLQSVRTAFRIEQNPANEELLSERRRTAAKEFLRAQTAFERSQVLARLTCGPEIYLALHEALALISKMGQMATNGEANSAMYTIAEKKLVAALWSLHDSMRKELRIEPLGSKNEGG